MGNSESVAIFSFSKSRPLKWSFYQQMTSFPFGEKATVGLSICPFPQPSTETFEVPVRIDVKGQNCETVFTVRPFECFLANI